MINEDNLIKDLKEWFASVNPNQRNFFNKNKVAIVLKEQIKDKWGRWKEEPRGNPRYGYEVKEYNEAVRKGYDGPPPEKPAPKLNFKGKTSNTILKELLSQEEKEKDESDDCYF